MKTRDKIARVSLYFGYVTRTWSIAARKVVISWCPQSNVRRCQRCIRSVATVADVSSTSAVNSMSGGGLFVPSWGRQHPVSCGFVLRVGKSGIYGRVKVFHVDLTIILILILVFLVGLIFKVSVWVKGQVIVKQDAWVIVSLSPEVRVSRCGWWEEERLGWIDNQGARVFWGYGLVFVVPLVLVVGSGDVDDAESPASSGTFWESLESVGAQTEFSNG